METVIDNDQPPAYPYEKPPAYIEVCPPTSPPSNNYTPPPHNTTGTTAPTASTDSPSSRVSHPAACRVRPASTTTDSVIICPCPFSQNHQEVYPEEHDFSEKLLIVISFFAMILALPIGIIAFGGSCSAYHTSDLIEKKKLRRFTIILNLFSYLAVILVVTIVPVVITQASGNAQNA